MSLATIKVDNVTPDKFAALQQSMVTEFKGHYHSSGTTGTLQDHAATVDYSYDEKNGVLTFDVEAIHRALFHKTPIEEVKKNLIGWIEEVVAEMPQKPVDETVPKSESVLGVPTTVSAPDVPENKTNESIPVDVVGGESTANLNSNPAPTGFQPKVAPSQQSQPTQPSQEVAELNQNSEVQKPQVG